MKFTRALKRAALCTAALFSARLLYSLVCIVWLCGFKAGDVTADIEDLPFKAQFILETFKMYQALPKDEQEEFADTDRLSKMWLIAFAKTYCATEEKSRRYATAFRLTQAEEEEFLRACREIRLNADLLESHVKFDDTTKEVAKLLNITERKL